MLVVDENFDPARFARLERSAGPELRMPRGPPRIAVPTQE